MSLVLEDFCIDNPYPETRSSRAAVAPNTSLGHIVRDVYCTNEICKEIPTQNKVLLCYRYTGGILL